MASRPRARRLLPLVLAAVACGESAALPQGPQAEGCVLAAGGTEGTRGTVPIRVEVVAAGLEVPWALAFLPGGDVLVTERPGRLRRIRGGVLEPVPVAELEVSSRSEAGLLGLALHPAFAANRLLYLYATVDAGGGTVNRVLRYRLSEDGASATLDRVILDDIPAATFHDGGRLRFGPDGMLYVGTGDAGQPELARDPASPAGKLLRVDPDGGVPADNPFPASPAYVIGIRNTQGFDWRADGSLVVTDHGPSGELGRRGHDEVNVARPGADLGWPTIFGCEAREGLVTPSIAFETAVPPGGAALYTGTAIPEWEGSLLVGVLGARHLHRVVFDPAQPDRVAAHELYLVGDPPDGYGRLRDVILGPDGDLWVTTSNCDSRGSCPQDLDRILRITR